MHDVTGLVLKFKRNSSNYLTQRTGQRTRHTRQDAATSFSGARRPLVEGSEKPVPPAPKGDLNKYNQLNAIKNKERDKMLSKLGLNGTPARAHRRPRSQVLQAAKESLVSSSKNGFIITN